MDQDTAVQDWPAVEEVASPAPVVASRRSGVLKRVGIVATGLIAGVIGVTTMSSSSASPAVATTQQAGPGAFQGQQGGPPGGFGQGGPGGRVAGESRVFGTLARVGSSSITVTAADGTVTTVPVGSSTAVVVDGASSTLSALNAGTTVVVHVVPNGSSTVAEMVLAGTSARGRGFGGPPPDQQAGTQQAPATTTGFAT